MELEIVNEEKNDLEMKIDNVTIAEILRVYLNEVDGVEFAAWRREHMSKPALLKIKTSGKTVKKAVSEAVSQIEKDSIRILSVLKK